jgi:hypothetical protein
MIVAAFISDRGDRYLPNCLASFLEHVEPVVKDMHIVNDELHRLGMAGAARAAWEWALDTGADYLAHIEEDFEFTRPIPLTDMAAILDHTPRLAQVVLKRQPWSDVEKAAGGQIETNPGAYTQHTEPRLGLQWVEHSTLFSLNPCLIPRRTLELSWRTDHHGGAEWAISDACRAAGMRFAYYGHRDDPPRCTHVGHVRASTGWRW